MVVQHRFDGPNLDLAELDGTPQVDEEDAQAARFVGELVIWRRARQQQEQVRVLGARRPDLLPVDDVAVAAAHGGGLQARRFGAGVGLGDAERLQAQLAPGDAGQVAALLLGRAVAQQRAHDVHLGVAGAGVAAAAVDLFEDDRGLGDAEPGAAVFGRDERGQPAGLGQRATNSVG